jgi:hypothetical protein
MVGTHSQRRWMAAATLLELALLLALGLGVAAVSRTEPLVAVSADARLEPSRSSGAVPMMDPRAFALNP